MSVDLLSCSVRTWAVLAFAKEQVVHGAAPNATQNMGIKVHGF